LGAFDTRLRFFYFMEIGVIKTRYFGRRVIYSSVNTITRDNVVEVLNKTLDTHRLNRQDINYLYEYYRGNQPILQRVKKHRPEINNKIVENHALEIVDFKKGYVFGEPIQYVRRGESEEISERITQLNEYMFAEDKAAKDKELAEWFFICGTAYRMILPDRLAGVDPDESPFEIDTLDPRSTYVVYNSGFGKKPLMAVKYIKNEEEERVYSIYTKDTYFEIVNDKIIKEDPHVLGDIPIIEYPANNARLGAFEVVLPLLDAINNITSCRMDGIEQFIQSFMKFINCDIDEEQFLALRELGALKIKSDRDLPADVDIVSKELNQSQVQVLKDDIYQTVLIICGMPDRKGGSRSTGDTGQAVLLRDGWSAAEARAKDTELMFKGPEKRFLRLALRILRDTANFNMRLSEIDIKFTRNKTDSLLVKTQGLQNQLEAGIHPQIAIAHCGLYSDPEQTYLDSLPYLEKWLTAKATSIPGNNKPDPGGDYD
jgi:SPP1 family phage portal protein